MLNMSSRTNRGRFRRHGHTEFIHTCAFCLDNHKSKDHLCNICEKTGHHEQYHKCRFCPKFHGSDNHICELCQGKGHSEKEHCLNCGERHGNICNICNDLGHCPKEIHCSICSGYHSDDDHECSICSSFGHEISLDCIPHLADRNIELEIRVTKLETTIRDLLNKLKILSN